MANQPFDGEVWDNLVGWQTILSRCRVLGVEGIRCSSNNPLSRPQEHFREGVGIMGVTLRSLVSINIIMRRRRVCVGLVAVSLSYRAAAHSRVAASASRIAQAGVLAVLDQLEGWKMSWTSCSSAGCSKRAVSKAAASENTRRTLWVTLRV